ncbi:MAG: hypothetical protein IPP91_10060 [Betaproteobacteria bacterium]|nr:hypothetical protein [Betaproteobacteria bacterium]
MPLLGPREKSELERLILERLTEYWNAHGSVDLLAPGVSLALDTKGPTIDVAGTGDALASVEIRTLFTALCHLSSDGPGSLPRDSLGSLATEATSALAAQVNRLVAG